MKVNQLLREGKTPVTTWDSLNAEAVQKFGEFGFATLESDDAASLVDMKAADKIADEKHGKGLMALKEPQMKKIINDNPALLRRWSKGGGPNSKKAKMAKRWPNGFKTV